MTARELRRFVVLGFASTHDALEAERVLQGVAMDVTPIPSPVGISSKCGIALRLEPEDEAEARRSLSIAGIGVEATTEMEDV